MVAAVLCRASRSALYRGPLDVWGLQAPGAVSQCGGDFSPLAHPGRMAYPLWALADPGEGHCRIVQALPGDALGHGLALSQAAPTRASREALDSISPVNNREEETEVSGA